MYGRLLLVPVKQGNQLSTLELIDEYGLKVSLAGRGSKAGGYWAAQRMPDGDGAGLTLAIGEGVATVLSGHQATGFPVVAALSSGNLVTVTKAMRERYPAADLVMLADLVKASGEPDHHAVEAARIGGARLAVPNFGPDRIPDMKDFNDLMILDGQEAVRCSIESATVPAAQSDQTEATASKLHDQGTEEAVKKYSYGSGYFEVSDRGVMFCGTDKNGNDLLPKWLCSRLDIIGKTRDHANSQWGRLLAWRDDDGNRRTLAMPAKALQGDGYDMRSELADLGVTINPSRAARDLLNAYVLVANSEARARCVERQGWHGDVYPIFLS